MPEEIRQYVRDSLAAGLSRDDIRAQLKLARWSETNINDALSAYLDAPTGGIPCPVRKPVATASEWLQYLLMFVSLCVSAVATGVMCWNAIDAVFPKEYYSWEPGQVRSALAALIVGGIVFAWTTYVTNREIVADPILRESRVRKWMTSAMLGCTGIAGLIFSILALAKIFGGDTTGNYTLKFVSVLLLAGGIFLSYNGSLGKEKALKA